MKRHPHKLLGSVCLVAGLFGCAPMSFPFMAALTKQPMTGAPAEASSGQAALIERIAVSPLKETWVTVTRSQGGKAEIVVHGVDGNRRTVAEVPGFPLQIAWSGDGQTIVYSERLERVIPGHYSDGDVPATETLGYRLMAVPATGGEPRLLKESSITLMPVAAPPGTIVSYVEGGYPGDVPLVDGAQPRPLPPSVLHLIALGTGKDEVVGPVGYMPTVKWAQDGTKAAFLEGPLGEEMGKLVVLDRRTHARREITQEPIRQFFWSLSGLSYFYAHQPRRWLLDALDGQPPTEKAVRLSYFPQPRRDGWYIPSPNGEKLLVYEAATGISRYAVYAATGDRFVDEAGEIPLGFYLHWKDDDHLVLVPSTPTGASTVLPVVVSPLDCEPHSEVRFDGPIRQSGAQDPDSAFTVEAPYFGGVYRYTLSIPGQPGHHHGVVTFRVSKPGRYAILTSSDVPVKVWQGPLFGAEGYGAAPSVQPVESVGYTRRDVLLEAGVYTLELGPTATGAVTIAIPQSLDPACYGKGIPYEKGEYPG